MMKRTPICAGLLLCLVAATPATRPVMEGPKGVVEALTTGLAVGDGAAIRGSLYAATDGERHMVDAMVAMSEAIARLRPVATKRYGQEGARVVAGDIAAGAADQRAKLDAAFQQIEGEMARLTFADPAADPITFRRIDGRWRIPVADRAANLTPAEMETRAADLTDMAKVVDEVTALCDGGKWQTANDVAIAIQERVMKSQQARLPATQSTPSTAPATAPATRPAR